MTEPSALDIRDFARLCAEKHPDELAAFVKERRIKEAKAYCDALAADLAEAQRVLDEVSK